MKDASKVVIVMGPKGSGKTTAAEHIVKEHGFTEFAYADSVKNVLSLIFPSIPIDNFYNQMFKEVPITLTGDEAKKARMIVTVKDWMGQFLEENEDFVRYVNVKSPSDKFIKEEIFDYIFENGDFGEPDEIDVTPRALMQKFGTDLVRALKDDIWIMNVIDKMAAAKNRGLSKFIISDARFHNEVGYPVTWAGESNSVVLEINDGTSYTNEHASESGITGVDAISILNKKDKSFFTIIDNVLEFGRWNDNKPIFKNR